MDVPVISPPYVISAEELVRFAYGKPDPPKREPGQLWRVGGGDSVRVVKLLAFRHQGAQGHPEWAVQDILSSKIYAIPHNGLKRQVTEMEAIAWASRR